MVDEATAKKALADAGYSAPEIESIWHEMAVAGGLRQENQLETIARGPTARSTRDMMLAFGLPIIGGVAGGAAVKAAGGGPWAAMGGRIFGQAAGGYTAGVVSGQSQPDAIRTGLETGAMGWLGEFASGTTGKGLLRTRGMSSAEVSEVGQMPAGAAMKSAMPGVTYPKPHTESRMMTQILQSAGADDELRMAARGLLHNINKRGTGGQGVIVLGRELMQPGPIGDDARLMVSAFEKALGLPQDELGSAMRQIATMRKLGESEQASVLSITRMIMGAAAGHGAYGVPGAVGGLVASGVGAGPTGVALMKGAPVVGELAAGVTSAVATQPQGYEPMPEDYRRRLASYIVERRLTPAERAKIAAGAPY